MKALVGGLTITAGLVVLLVACQTGDSPTAATQPTNPADTNATVGTHAAAFPVPGSVPVPGGPGPTQVPGAPGTGASPTPTPTASPTPTPTPTPTPLPCPATASYSSTETPYLTAGGGDGPGIVVSGLDPACKVQSVKLYTMVTAPDLAVSTATGQMLIMLHLLGRVITFDVVDIAIAPGGPLTGAAMGTTCSDLVFKEGGADFATAVAPYTGTFKPLGDRGVHDGLFTPFKSLAANGDWELAMYRLDAAVAVECFKLELGLAR